MHTIIRSHVTTFNGISELAGLNCGGVHFGSHRNTITLVLGAIFLFLEYEHQRVLSASLSIYLPKLSLHTYTQGLMSANEGFVTESMRQQKRRAKSKCQRKAFLPVTVDYTW